MRVIAGTYRSRRLIAPRGSEVRPTSDRLRETLFNVLAPRIEGAVFADLFAGSGAVGIEALSRGARFAYFVEQAPASCSAIRANLAALAIRNGFALECASVQTALPRLNKACDIVFLDPPYAAADDYLLTMNKISRIAGELLSPDAIVIAEHDRKMGANLAESFGGLTRYRSLTQGDASLSFYRIQTAGET